MIQKSTSGIESPIFVVGAPRSGTTLVGTILGRHPDVYSPGESHFFEDIWTRRDIYGPIADQAEIVPVVERLMTIFGRYSFPETQEVVEKNIDSIELSQDVEERGGGYASLYCCFMSTLAESSGKKRFCDDTPKHLFYVDEIFALFAEAKIVALVRDPRDFLNSYKNYWKTSDDSIRMKALYHPIITSMIWRSSAKKILEAKKNYGSQQFLVLTYEDFVRYPISNIRNLCAFLDLEFDKELVKVNRENSSFGESPNGIFTTSIGRWTQHLSDEETWWVQRINSAETKELRYQEMSTSPSRIRLFGDFLSLPFALIRALIVNRERRGPTLQYLLKRLSR